jgi:hypothetical protein
VAENLICFFETRAQQKMALPQLLENQEVVTVKTKRGRKRAAKDFTFNKAGL